MNQSERGAWDTGIEMVTTICKRDVPAFIFTAVKVSNGIDSYEMRAGVIVIEGKLMNVIIYMEGCETSFQMVIDL